MSSEDCVHHWVIETADGPRSSGKCQKCDLEKVFYNSIEEGFTNFALGIRRRKNGNREYEPSGEPEYIDF